ncbi:MAG: hypothetical protein JSV78_01570, partial [Phycisphaerales bacterium]
MVTAGQTFLVVYGLFSLVQIGPWDHDATLTEGLDSPARIAVTSDQVLVADTFGNRVVRYDLNGAYLGSWPEPAGPVAVQAHPDGRIFVSRRDDGQVAVYDAGFAFLRLLGDGAITFEKATDLATDSVTGRLYVVDSGADRVAAFDADEQLVLMFGVRGSRTGEFKYPGAIAIDEVNQRVLVADQDNFRVQVFTPSGVFLLSFGYRIKYLPGGSSEGWFVRTAGLAVDDDGLTYAADSSMSRIRAFTPTGAELGVVADYGFDPGELRTPAGIAFDGEGRLFVANSGAGSVEIFSQSRDKGSSGRGVVYEGTNAWHLERVVSGIADPAWPGSSILPWLPQGLAAGTSEWEPPHMLDDVMCGRCHDIDGQPGGHLGLAEGQTNLCFSCHTVAGQALRQPFRWMNIADPYGTNPLVPDGHGHSHAWGVPAVNSEADSIGPTPGGAMALHLDDGNIKCGTCHNQHNSQAGTPFLRISNQGDAMCKQCHAPRNEGLGELGTHAVGFAYPEGVGEFPPADELTPLIVPYGLVQCTSCHAPHYADSGGANDGLGDGMLLRTTNDEALCVKCHQEHVLHTPASEWQPTCIECHDVHDPPSENLSLVARIVYNQTLQEDKPVVFLARQGPHSFSDGSPSVIDGICQVCHTATSYHRHDGTGAPHHGGSNCTNCHPHSTGFMPAGGSCIECHGVAQDNGDGVPPGGRRAIVGEFPVDNPHAHYGAEFDDSACLICHDLATHMNGNVELVDADDGSIYSFVLPTDLAASPDLSDFCMSCHDDDGATRLPIPQDP